MPFLAGVPGHAPMKNQRAGYVGEERNLVAAVIFGCCNGHLATPIELNHLLEENSLSLYFLPENLYW